MHHSAEWVMRLLVCRQGLGDPELRTPGPGLPYPDPEFTAPAMEAVNATLAQQTGYCEGASPVHAMLEPVFEKLAAS